MMPCRAELSVLIRVRNEADDLRDALARLVEQVVDAPWEIVVLDNESDDASAAVAAAAGAKVFVLPRQLFGYGRAINVGVELCQGTFVVLLSAHAWPQRSGWLQTMLDEMRQNPRVAGAYCRQRPSMSLCRQELARFKTFGDVSYRLDLPQLTARVERGDDAYEICRFSNAACIVRRARAVELPFRDLPYAEDRAFALDCLLAGHEVAYVTRASVVYERPASLRSLYHTGRRAQIAKQLVRELAGVGLARQTRRYEAPRRLARLVLKPAATAVRIIAAPIVERASAGRAARYAVSSWGTSAGMLVGALSWRRYRAYTGSDAALTLQAQRAVRSY
jgi:glycosyltransferase involved in cell wall biosynthesis